MAQFLTTKEVEAAIDRVFRTANRRLFVVSPYLKLSRLSQDRLDQAGARGVEIDIVYGKERLAESQWKKIQVLSGVSLFYLENLHAKIYANEREAVVASANLYEAFQTANREVGVLLTQVEDTRAFTELWAEMKSIAASGEVELLPEWTLPQAYCVRCKSSMVFGPSSPLCPECSIAWSRYRNPEYRENYCHMCGEKRRVCVQRPFCQECYDHMTKDEEPAL